MKQEIQYKGYTANPTDYENSDGELALSLNLINEDEQLKSIFQPKHLFNLQRAGDKILCIHKTSEFTHYIVIDYNSSIRWVDANDTTTFNTLGDRRYVGATKATAIGNTLCVPCDAGMFYFLWSVDEDGNAAYKILGNEMPELKISFGLQCEMKTSDAATTTFMAKLTTNTDGRLLPTEVEESSIAALTESVLAKVNKLIAEEATQKGKFCMPFFVRYAYRLYDGSLTRHSAPILMLPTNGTSPIVLGNATSVGASSNGYYATNFNYIVCAPMCGLDMKCVTDPDNLSDYADIIKAVDVFVSAPIYSYDQSGKVESFAYAEENDTFGIYSLANNNPQVALRKYNKWNTTDAIRAALEINPAAKIESKLPTKDEETYLTELASCSNFYFIKSYPIDELTQTRTLVDIPSDTLESLVAREAMTDDYDSHDQLMPENSFSYNSRLILSGMKKKLFDGYFNQSYVETLLTNIVFTELNNVFSFTDNSAACFNVQKVRTYIKQNGNTYVVEEDLSSDSVRLPAVANESGMFVPFAYYPNSGAYRMELYETRVSGTRMQRITLKPHDMLNGAFFFDNFAEQSAPVVVTTLADVSDAVVSLPNKLYTSEVNNPFFFPVLGIVTVGTGKILGVSTAAKALSQGQFGEFPLYAFTDEGVWALRVSSTGTFSATQPITRDVCTNPESITQIDDTVLFVTDRGIILLSGSEHRCVSDVLLNYGNYDIKALPHFAELYAMLGLTGEYCTPTEDILTYLADCRMIYDYVHQHIIVFNPAVESGVPLYPYAYVLSLGSGRWGMMYCDLLAPTNSYPDALAVTHEGGVVSFAHNASTNSVGMFVTRPIKFGEGNTFKSVHTLLQRGNFFPRTSVKTALYGSRDLRNWYLIGTSRDNAIQNLRGTPYKYFRVAGITSLTKGESLNGATFDIEARELNNLH